MAWTLIVAGVMTLGKVGLDAARAAAYQRQYHRVLHSAGQTLTTSAARSVSTGDPIGWLEIPRIGVSAGVVHGDSDALLATAIGHLPDTPLPWRDGNSALAGHRDTFFRSLRHVRPDDMVRLRTRHGDFQYRVRETFIVDAEDVWVLDSTSAAMLTLITCYPFDYVGNAPRRFIVRAERIHPPRRDVRTSDVRLSQDIEGRDLRMTLRG
jgi:sortase A